MNEIQPLVSVGIPTYNRPEGLRRTLECITAQTYNNLEIIISDNCSSNHLVREVAEEFQYLDKRIQYFRQNSNHGAAYNFKFVLEKATGEYFMWAADDDEWEIFYIKRIMDEFNISDKSVIACNFEAQYMDENCKKFDYFSEGYPFYNYTSIKIVNRLKYILKYNYGNLIYSIYRTSILKSQSIIFVENEIPFFLQIAFHGNWKVLPEVGFFKKTNINTYLQARWEITGGRLPGSSPLNLCGLSNILNNYKYHKRALNSIKESIYNLELNYLDKIKLAWIATFSISRHFIVLTFIFNKRKR